MRGRFQSDRAIRRRRFMVGITHKPFCVRDKSLAKALEYHVEIERFSFQKNAHHSTETAAVVMPAPTAQSISLSPDCSLSSISIRASGMLALDVLPNCSTFR